MHVCYSFSDGLYTSNPHCVLGTTGNYTETERTVIVRYHNRQGMKGGFIELFLPFLHRAACSLRHVTDNLLVLLQTLHIGGQRGSFSTEQPQESQEVGDSSRPRPRPGCAADPDRSTECCAPSERQGS